MNDSTVLALALTSFDGVGRVTAGRLLTHFSSYEALRRFPREQVLTRIKGAPHAADLVGRLFDDDEMARRLDRAKRHAQALEERDIHLLSRHDDGWPECVEALPRSVRPLVLYTYGAAGTLQVPRVALVAGPTLSEGAFERVHELTGRLGDHGIAVATGAAGGVAAAVQKRVVKDFPSASPLLVAGCGMARVAPPMRPVVSAAVRAGGLLVSPFPMDHGPFDHDAREQTMLLAALCPAAVFVEPAPDTYAWEALAWALDAGRPVFGLPADEHPLPERVHPLRDAVDYDWVAAALQPDVD